MTDTPFSNRNSDGGLVVGGNLHPDREGPDLCSVNGPDVHYPTRDHLPALVADLQNNRVLAWLLPVRMTYRPLDPKRANAWGNPCPDRAELQVMVTGRADGCAL